MRHAISGPRTAARAAALSPVHQRPFQREGLRQRLAAFALVALAAEASLALPPGPASALDTTISVALLAMVGIAIVLPWNNLPEWATVIVPVAYAGSVLMLTLAIGTAGSGTGVVLFVPLVWTALYHRRWESAVVIGVVVLSELVMSLTPVVVPAAVLFRRGVLWGLVGLGVSLAIHGLRERLRVTFGERERMHASQTESLRRVVALELAAEELTASLDPDEVVAIASRLLDELVSPAGLGMRRAQYLRSVDGVVHLLAQHDEVGHVLAAGYLLCEHPRLERAVSTGETSHGPIDVSTLGPSVRTMVESLGITHTVHIPVKVDGAVHGVLVISLRGFDAPPDLVEQCKAVGHLTELALSNALSHDREREMATTDVLTGLPNRRSFENLIARRPGRGSFSIIVIDVDGLKQVNDTKGHLAGDALLAAVAAALNGVMRRGDVVARIGGDEFAALSFESEPSAAEGVAARMLAALSRTRVIGITPRASIGIASGGEGDDSLEIFQAADTAMYQAKQQGGSRYAIARPAPAGAEPARV